MKKKRSIPFGYTISNGKITVNRAEADVICEIFEDYIAGSSMKTLAARMTKAEIPYTEKRTNWNKNVIARILENRKYVGEGEYGQIIDADFFRQANLQKKVRATKTPKPEEGNIVLVKPKVRCACCGSVMYRGVDRKKDYLTMWRCGAPDCRTAVAISDDELFRRIQTRLNLIIDNADMLTDSAPYKEHEEYDSLSAIEGLERLCDTGNYDDQYLIQVIMGNASDLYNHFSNSRLLTVVNVNAAFANAAPTDTFNAELFLLTVKHVTLRQDGNLTLTLKSDIEI